MKKIIVLMFLFGLVAPVGLALSADNQPIITVPVASGDDDGRIVNGEIIREGTVLNGLSLMRFELPIPRDATIETAHINVLYRGNDSPARVALERSGNCQRLDVPVTGRVFMRAVDWTPVDGFDWQLTPNLSQQLQKLVNHPTWEGGVCVLFDLTPNWRFIAAAESSDAAQFIVTYDAP